MQGATERRWKPNRASDRGRIRCAARSRCGHQIGRPRCPNWADPECVRRKCCLPRGTGGGGGHLAQVGGVRGPSSLGLGAPLLVQRFLLPPHQDRLGGLGVRIPPPATCHLPPATCHLPPATARQVPLFVVWRTFPKSMRVPQELGEWRKSREAGGRGWAWCGSSDSCRAGGGGGRRRGAAGLLQRSGNP